MADNETLAAEVAALTERIERTTPPLPTEVDGEECFVCGAPATGPAVCDAHEEDR